MWCTQKHHVRDVFWNTMYVMCSEISCTWCTLKHHVRDVLWNTMYVMYSETLCTWCTLKHLCTWCTRKHHVRIIYQKPIMKSTNTKRVLKWCRKRHHVHFTRLVNNAYVEVIVWLQLYFFLVYFHTVLPYSLCFPAAKHKLLRIYIISS